MGSPSVFLLNRATAAAAAVTVFFLAVFWRRAGKSGSASDHKEAHHSYSRVDDEPAVFRDDDVPEIFLSHSGRQKAFVEHLYDALQSANHTAAFNKHSLPKGSPFPPHIIRAARGCKLGVVVLSDDFLTSKWPMLELEMLVQQRGPGAIVLPLFYKLSPGDFKSAIPRWRHVWKKMAGQHADQWERAVKVLNSFNGEIFIPGTSEIAYIKRVVRLICNLVPSRFCIYDLSQVKGHQRLAEEVASQFEEAARQSDKVCMVGLYGVGGMGKTTICKVMCNFYTSLYSGKSHHIEFPSDGDYKKIVQECKKALKKLANLSDEHLLNKVDSFDQVVQLMKENLRGYDLFLAIDNVWESSLEAAKRMLGVSFSANSKILLTSRSEVVLKDLVRGHSNTSVAPLPSPDQDEAFQIFQETFGLADLKSSVNRNLLDSVLNTCFVSGKYHALALKALAQHVKRVCALEGLDKIEDSLSFILQGSATSSLHNVEDVIRLNYVNLAVEKQHMFLDIVAVLMSEATARYFGLTYAMAHHWLSILYKEYSKSTITKLIYELALDGLIQLESIDKSAGNMIRVQSLYSDLAQREAARSAIFFTDGSATSVEEIEWERLERVILRGGHHSPRFIEELQWKECRNLQVLCAENIDFRSGIHLDLMPSLRVLKLCSGILKSIKNWSAATGLAIVHLVHLHCNPPLERIQSIPCLEELTIWKCETEGLPNLDGCEHLRELFFAEKSLFKQREGSYFNSLTNLESLHIEGSLTTSLNLNALVQLQKLEIEDCEFIDRIEGLQALKNLEELIVRRCRCLKTLDGLSGLTCSDRLVLWRNDSMKEEGGTSNWSLKSVVVESCGALKKMPDLSELNCLEKLELYGNDSMEEVGGISSTLKSVVVGSCGALKKMPDLSELTCLEKLELSGNESMEEVGGKHLSPTLKHLSIYGCRSLRRFPSLNESVHLESLMASACLINNIDSLEKLQELHLIEGEWTSIERVISGVRAHLQRLTIEECDSLLKLEVGCLPSNLKYLEITECKALEEIGDLSELHSLETLFLSDCPSLKKLGGLCIPPLQILKLYDCGSLEVSTIPDVSLIPDIRCAMLNGNPQH